MVEEERSYWGIFGVGLCAPFVLSVVMFVLFHLAVGPGFLVALAYTCMWPVAGFGLAVYSRVYESDELAAGAMASGIIGTLVGVFLVYMIVTSYAEGMASFSQ